MAREVVCKFQEGNVTGEITRSDKRESNKYGAFTFSGKIGILKNIGYGEKLYNSFLRRDLDNVIKVAEQLRDRISQFEAADRQENGEVDTSDNAAAVVASAKSVNPVAKTPY